MWKTRRRDATAAFGSAVQSIAYWDGRTAPLPAVKFDLTESAWGLAGEVRRWPLGNSKRFHTRQPGAPRAHRRLTTAKIDDCAPLRPAIYAIIGVVGFGFGPQSIFGLR
jgi:hypothetical protein